MRTVLKSLTELAIGLIQLTIYGYVWSVGVVCGVVAFLMGICAIADTATRAYFSEHFLMSAFVFLAANVGAMICLVLKGHLERRWEHLGI